MMFFLLLSLLFGLISYIFSLFHRALVAKRSTTYLASYIGLGKDTTAEEVQENRKAFDDMAESTPFMVSLLFACAALAFSVIALVTFVMEYNVN